MLLRRNDRLMKAHAAGGRVPARRLYRTHRYLGPRYSARLRETERGKVEEAPCGGEAGDGAEKLPRPGTLIKCLG